MHKIIIYQLLVRLFGNKNTNNVFNGSITENGCGKFDDITDVALYELKRMGITHVWYTGVIEHATTTDYSDYGIEPDSPDVVKGKAGSPYAIKDYYDVAPDLAVHPDKRMQEFEQLVERTHNAGLKVIIDFVANHVARNYKSDAKPSVIADLGENDDKTVYFDPDNNFYYLIDETFVVPEEPCNERYDCSFESAYTEYPAKVTGNNVFNPMPSVDDWYETVKLNYGVYEYKTYFFPIPNTWRKMMRILQFWANRGVDGFRCDMCEMVPKEFWEYAITAVKERSPEIIFIGEAYDPDNYRDYLSAGFDYLYDKTGLYNLLRAAITGYSSLYKMLEYLDSGIKGIQHNLLTFLENHDEQRFASPYFADDPFKAIPLMTLAATLHPSPVMIYFGQEVGAKALGKTGFSGDDGKTSIFDYTHVPELQQWINNGRFDGGQLTPEQKKLRNFYSKILNICRSEEAIASGRFGNLLGANSGPGGIDEQTYGFNKYMNYAFARYTENSRLIIFVTIDTVAPDLYIKLSWTIFENMGLQEDKKYTVEDILFSNYKKTIKGANFVYQGFHFVGKPMSAAIFRIY
jgi:glycosidase